MATRVAFHFFFLVALLDSLAHSRGAIPTKYRAPFNRSSFPADFVFGAATSAYQIEGEAHGGGRGPSIWDTFAKAHPGKIWDQSTGDVAIDFYHRYKEDINFLKDIGMDAFRFSISWSRILPRGKVSGGINKEGVNFYNNVINDLLSKGIKPFVTLLHWDVPQTLEDEYGGFLNTNIVNDFQDYAEVCFKQFGDRVKFWITMNEPISFSLNGYTIGTQAPGRCSSYAGNCTTGNSATEPYIVAHNQLLAHAAAAKLYREKYKVNLLPNLRIKEVIVLSHIQIYQKGEIGITLASHWLVPKTQTVAGVKAAYRGLDFLLGWFLHPLTYGDYPPSMRAVVGHRLPKFSQVQSNLVKGSMDFLGMNYYTSYYASFALTSNRVNLSYNTDSQVNLTPDINGVLIGQKTDLDWLYVCPKGIRSLMLYIMKNYKNPPIYITENGMADSNNSSMSVQEALKDNLRIEYFYGHLWHLQKSIKEGAKVKGHFAWSFLDDFEWDAGYTVRFGLGYIDYKDGLKRYPKHSSFWYKKFLLKAT